MRKLSLALLFANVLLAVINVVAIAVPPWHWFNVIALGLITAASLALLITLPRQ